MRAYWAITGQEAILGHIKSEKISIKLYFKVAVTNHRICITGNSDIATIIIIIYSVKILGS